MNKPNITEGEWDEWFGNVKCKGESVADCDTNLSIEPDEVKIANAKAISAVPDMIDALIDVDMLLEVDGYAEDGLKEALLKKHYSKQGVQNNDTYKRRTTNITLSLHRTTKRRRRW